MLFDRRQVAVQGLAGGAHRRCQDKCAGRGADAVGAVQSRERAGEQIAVDAAAHHVTQARERLIRAAGHEGVLHPLDLLLTRRLGHRRTSYQRSARRRDAR